MPGPIAKPNDGLSRLLSELTAQKCDQAKVSVGGLTHKDLLVVLDTEK